MGQIGTATSLDSESDMLPQDPPPLVIRAAARLLIAIFAVGLVASIVVPLPEAVHCDFVLVPKEGSDPIQSPRTAVVYRVGASEGETVSKGTELYVLRSDEIRGLDTQSRSAQEDLRTREEDLAKAEAAYTSQIDIKDAEISQSESEVKFREKHAVTNKELVTRLEKLSKAGGISGVEMIRLRLDLAESEKNQSVAERTLQQVKLERQRMETDYSRLRSERLAEIEKLKYRLSGFKGDLMNSSEDLLSIRAPYDAVVVSMSQRNAGSVVQSGQELCQLARTEAEPRARLIVKEAALPRLKVGQRVRFFLDAYPYQRYGTVDAKLDWVSPSAVASPDGPRFVALASLDDSTISKRKDPLALRVGMRGEARIVVGKRTLIESIFEPLKQLRESVLN
ncbi:MAG: HlyD family efflux transporter periplasmic adaptor subunit [Chthoniobacterales bacterium]